jgi:type II secretory pathway pseudopilin PulG
MKLGLLGLTLALAAHAGAASPTFTLLPTTLVMAPGESSHKFTVTVRVSDLAAGLTSPELVTLADENTPAWPAVQVVATFKGTSNKAASDQLLSFEVNVSGFPPAASQSRVFTLSFGDVHASLPYTLTNLGGKTFGWTVKAPAEWNLRSMQALPIAIHLNDLPASSIQMYRVDLTTDDKLKGTAGTQDFLLCSNAGPEECAPVTGTLAAKGTETIYVRPKGELPYGTLKGNISILAAEKDEPEVLPVTIYSPRPRGVFYAVLILMGGVLAAALMQFVLPSFKQNREQRQVVLSLLTQIKELQAEFEKLPQNLQTAAALWAQSLKTLKEDLSSKSITLLFSPTLPQAYASQVAQLETFKSKMEESGAEFNRLRLLLRSGLEAVAALQTAHPGHNADMDMAAADIAILPAAGADAAIATRLAALRITAGVAAHVLLAGAPRNTPDSELRSITVQLLVANIVAWVFWGAVSVLSGLLLLVYQNPGFGTRLDLLICFLWGLGVSVAGGQSPQTTPTAVGKSLGINLPGGK